MKGLQLIAPGLLWAAGLAAQAQGLAPAPTPPDASIEQRLDARVPMDLPLVDAQGHAVQLGHYFGDRPVLLVLGYYRCPQLCGLVMHGLLEGLYATGLPRSGYRIVRVSLDPDDTPATATARRDADLAYADFLQRADAAPQPLALNLLMGRPPEVSLLAQRVGYRFQRNADAPGYAHPAAAIVLTPEGRVSRYLMGVRFEPQALRMALVEAGGGRVGDLTDRIALLCAHIDPRLGRHSAAVLQGVRGLGLSLVLLLAALVWHQHRGLSRRDRSQERR